MALEVEFVVTEFRSKAGTLSSTLLPVKYFPGFSVFVLLFGSIGIPCRMSICQDHPSMVLFAGYGADMLGPAMEYVELAFGRLRNVA